MSDIKWLPDGQKTFDKLMAAVPEAMRDAIKPKLLQMLAGKAAGQSVSADLVKTWVKEDLPEPQRSALMAALGMKPDGDISRPPRLEQRPGGRETPRSCLSACCRKCLT